MWYLRIFSYTRCDKRYKYYISQWWYALNRKLCDKFCQWLAAGRLFSPCTLVFFTNEIDYHVIVEILLKMVLNCSNVSLHKKSYLLHLIFGSSIKYPQPTSNHFLAGSHRDLSYIIATVMCLTCYKISKITSSGWKWVPQINIFHQSNKKIWPSYVAGEENYF